MNKRMWIAVLISAVLSSIATFLVCLVAAVILRSGEIEGLRYEYSGDVDHHVALTESYVRHFDQHGVWPAPGTYDNSEFKYLQSYTDPDEKWREDSYQSIFHDGMHIDFELMADGKIYVTAKIE